MNITTNMEAINPNKILNNFCKEKINKFNSKEFCEKEYDVFFKLDNKPDPPTTGTAMIHPEFNYNNEEHEENASW